MTREELVEVLTNPISLNLLTSAPLCRLAYIGMDGFPRCVPLGFWWKRNRVLMATFPDAAKVRALGEHPRVSLTIDTHDRKRGQLRALMIRGEARVAVIDGVSPDYVNAGHKLMPDEGFEEFEQQAEVLYDQQAIITVRPLWAKLLDFESSFPRAMEDRVRALQGATVAR